MSDVPSLPRRLQNEEVDFRSPVSESTMSKMAGTVNFILDNSVIYPGQVISFAGPEANVPNGYIVCDGRQVLRTTYSNLFTAIGTYWGNGNGVTTFNVPDLRGLFLRMVDTTIAQGSAGRDPDAASRAPIGSGTAGEPGSYQADEFASHSHKVPFQSGSGPTQLNAQPSFVDPSSFSPNTSDSGGNETRPKNAFVIYLIKT